MRKGPQSATIYIDILRKIAEPAPYINPQEILLVGAEIGPVKIKDRKIFYINGIQTKYRDAIETAKKISETTGHPLYLVYSPARGGIESDILKALEFKDHQTIPKEGKLLKGELLNSLENGFKVTLFAHSRGAIISFNIVRELFSDLKSGFFNNLHVVTFGGFCPPEKEWNLYLQKNNYQSIKHPRDIVPDLYHKSNEEVLKSIVRNTDKLLDINDAHSINEYLENCSLDLKKEIKCTHRNHNTIEEIIFYYRYIGSGMFKEHLFDNLKIIWNEHSD